MIQAEIIPPARDNNPAFSHAAGSRRHFPHSWRTAAATNTPLTQQRSGFGRRSAAETTYNDPPYLFLNVLRISDVVFGHISRYVQSHVDVSVDRRHGPLLQGRHFSLRVRVCRCVLTVVTWPKTQPEWAWLGGSQDRYGKPSDRLPTVCRLDEQCRSSPTSRMSKQTWTEKAVQQTVTFRFKQC